MKSSGKSSIEINELQVDEQKKYLLTNSDGNNNMDSEQFQDIKVVDMDGDDDQSESNDQLFKEMDLKQEQMIFKQNILSSNPQKNNDTIKQNESNLFKALNNRHKTAKIDSSMTNSVLSADQSNSRISHVQKKKKDELPRFGGEVSQQSKMNPSQHSHGTAMQRKTVNMTTQSHRKLDGQVSDTYSSNTLFKSASREKNKSYRKTKVQQKIVEEANKGNDQTLEESKKKRYIENALKLMQEQKAQPLLMNRKTDKPESIKRQKKRLLHAIEQMNEKQKINQEIQKRYEKYYNKWRDYDLYTCILAIIGLAISAIDWEYIMGFNDVNVRLSQSKNNFNRIITVITTIMAIFTLIKRYQIKHKWVNYHLPREVANRIYGLKKTQKISRNDLYNRNYWSNVGFVFDFCLLIACPWPQFDWIIDIACYNVDGNQRVVVQYLLSDFLFALMWLRITFIIRAVFNYSKYTDLHAKKLCKSYGFTANIRFTYKSLLEQSPQYAVVLTLLASVIVLGYIERIFELPYLKQQGIIAYDNIFNPIYQIFITMTSVGYGDYVAYTQFGRATCILAAFWGTFLVGLQLLSVSYIFALTKDQKMAMHHLFLTRKAAESITSAFKYFMAKRQYERQKQIYLAQRDFYLSSVNHKAMHGLQYIKSHRSDGVGTKRTSSEHNDFYVDQDDQNMIQDQIDREYLSNLKAKMQRNLDAFSEERNQLKALREEASEEQEQNITLIKNEVIDLCDRFEGLQRVVKQQQEMMQAILYKMDEEEQTQQKQGNFMYVQLDSSISKDQSKSKINNNNNDKNLTVQPQSSQGSNPVATNTQSVLARPTAINVGNQVTTNTKTQIFNSNNERATNLFEHLPRDYTAAYRQGNSEFEAHSQLSKQWSIRHSPFYQRDKRKYNKKQVNYNVTQTQVFASDPSERQ